jgi:hypothetical protein
MFKVSRGRTAQTLRDMGRSTAYTPSAAYVLAHQSAGLDLVCEREHLGIREDNASAPISCRCAQK